MISTNEPPPRPPPRPPSTTTKSTHPLNLSVLTHDPVTEISTILSCLITWAPMNDPVILSADGHTYERIALQKWFSQHYTSPTTGQHLSSRSITPNHAMRALALPWTKLLAQQSLDKETRIHQDATISTLENVAREELEKRLALESRLNGMKALVECKNFEIEYVKRLVGQMKEIVGDLETRVDCPTVVDTKQGAVTRVNKMLDIKDGFWYAIIVGLIEIGVT
ncbi:UNVERIFIED_CONTAM: hypothetical protein HDU68_005675, partial [Siphonaria sp. JEL0065]